MIKPGAWRLLKIIDKNKYEQTDFFSHEIKSIIIDKDTNEKFICDPKDYILFNSADDFVLYEKTHNCQLKPLNNTGSIYKISLDDIWLNQIFNK